MTIWQPDLDLRHGIRYIAIADALAEDVRAGRLRRGDRLPTHRDLAYRLGVTVGTVSRGYAEAERRGLIAGEIGRGTFVRDGTIGATAIALAEQGEAVAGALIDFSLNVPARVADDELLGTTLTALAKRGGISRLLDYQPHRGTLGHRTVGAAWIARTGLKVGADQIVVTAGGQHAMMVAFAGLTQPGDLVLTEAMTYPGMKTLAGLLHLRLQGVAGDEDGILPEAFEAACNGARPKALYCMPSIQNPTGVMMPDARRRAVAEIAAAHHVAIVEDDVYGFLADDAPPPMVCHAPQLGFYLTSLSKSMAPGLRIGFLATPAGMQSSFAAIVRTTNWMAAPLMAEIAATWIGDGTGERLEAERRAESIARQRIARRLLGAFDYVAHPAGFHCWLRLPVSWRTEDFVAQARLKGVLLTPAETFAVGRAGPPTVRICLGGASNREELTRGLELLADLLRSPPDHHLSIV